MQSTSLAELRHKNAPVEIGFTTSTGFESLQRIANMFAQSSLVPKAFQGNVANCCIAVEMAIRMGMSPLMATQHLYIVHGTPSWSSSFLIACFNQCGRFTPISYKFEGNPHTDEWGCRAVSTYTATGEQIEGTLVTIGMAKKEGWFGKNGSKWQTMPEQMLRYRAAAWMIRSTAPEIGMGFHTAEEVREMDMTRNEDGVYTIESTDITPKTEIEATTAPQEETPNARAQLAALRAEAIKISEIAGLENPYSCAPEKWNTAQCNAMIEKALAKNKEDTENTMQYEAEATQQEQKDNSTIFCEQLQKEIPSAQCEDCSYRQGCPSYN